MKPALAIGTLGLAFALSGQAGQDQQKEPSPREKERIAIVHACNNIANTVIPGESRMAHNYAVQGCVLSYYAAKEAITYARKF